MVQAVVTSEIGFIPFLFWFFFLLAVGIAYVSLIIKYRIRFFDE